MRHAGKTVEKFSGEFELIQSLRFDGFAYLETGACLPIKKVTVKKQQKT